MVVSHDRAFLDEVAQEIIVFRNKKLTYHAGGLVSGLPANYLMTFRDSNISNIIDTS